MNCYAWFLRAPLHILFLSVISNLTIAYASDQSLRGNGPRKSGIQIGVRPFYLLQGLEEGQLKDTLTQCQNGPFHKTDFSLAHRGAALQLPEHSDVAYEAGARMGAGIVECDVTFTKDGELVCRHSECDLHTTTDIVAVKDLNAKCTHPWTGPGQNPPPQCCTSDLTLDEFRRLTPKMDASNPDATTPEDYLAGTVNWRTDLYTGHGKVVSFKESIEINQKNGVKHAPELKEASHQDRLDAIFGGQTHYAKKFIDTLRTAGVKPKDVYPQSFSLNDIIYWLNHDPDFGKQAVYLDDIDPSASPPIPGLNRQQLQAIKESGVNMIAPPIWALLSLDDDGKLVPSQYAKDIRKAGLDIIAWTLERSDLSNGASNAGWYYQFDPQGRVIKSDSDIYKVLDVLARKVKVRGVFSDWAGTVTYYANCMQRKGRMK